MLSNAVASIEPGTSAHWRTSALASADAACGSAWASDASDRVHSELVIWPSLRARVSARWNVLGVVAAASTIGSPGSLAGSPGSPGSLMTSPDGASNAQPANIVTNITP